MTIKAFLGLNEHQLKVASSVDGKKLVLAGAGSGKTRTLTRRIQYLIEDINVQPNNILAISFTRKSSNEIKERIIDAIGSKALDIWLGTFHSACMKILMPNQNKISSKYITPDIPLTVLDNSDTYNIIKDIAANYGYTDKKEIKGFVSLIGYWGNYGYHFTDNPPEILDKDLLEIYFQYGFFKKNSSYIDFNDILYVTYKLLEDNPDLAYRYSNQFKYILVDECQDMNDIQFSLVKILSKVHNNFMLIGDDKQTIYSFRGSNVENMMNIRTIDSSVETMYLERNYRSTTNIVNASNGLIAKNKGQLENVSYSEKNVGAPIYLYEAPDNVKEADYVSDMIRGLVDQKGYNYSDIAIIYRNNYLSRQIEMAFRQKSIPYEVFGGRDFYERLEIRTLVCYLRAILNPNDNLAYENIINNPKRSIGQTSIDRIKMFADESKIPFSVALLNAEDIPKITKKAKENIIAFNNIISECREFNSNNPSVYALIKKIINDTNYMSQYSVEKTEDETKVENIVELTNMIMVFDEEHIDTIDKKDSLLSLFLSQSMLSSNPNDEKDEDEMNKVRLTTVHSSKGLEFKVVFLIAVEKGIFPGRRSELEGQLEEERRAMYVAMTRAEELLFLSYSANRYEYSGSSPAGPSVFISDIPKEFISIVGYNS